MCVGVGSVAHPSFELVVFVIHTIQYAAWTVIQRRPSMEVLEQLWCDAVAKINGRRRGTSLFLVGEAIGGPVVAVATHVFRAVLNAFQVAGRLAVGS